MSTVPATKQVVFIPGELQIDSGSAYKESNGLISFIGAFKTKLGQIRAYGFGNFQSLLMDASNCAVGFEVRTSTNQGDATLLAGKGDQFPLTVAADVTQIKSLTVTQLSTQYRNQFFGDSLAKITRINTTAASNLTNSILDITQQQWKVGETMQVQMGPSTFSGCSVWSYTQPTSTSGSSTDNYSSLSMKRSNVLAENIRMFTTGNVSIPARLDVGTIFATNYLNLPALPPAQLLPITLNATDGRVGINQTTPTQALDVTGNAHITGTVDAEDLAVRNSLLVAGPATIFELALSGIPNAPKPDVLMYDTTTKGVSYGPAPDPSVLPLTLDTTNNRVGINQTTPSQALDVTGDAHITGMLDVTDLGVQNSLLVVGAATVGQVTANGVFTNGDTTTGTLHLESIANSSKSNVLMYDTTTKEVSYGATPAPDIAPITLDKINNRVGINFASPSYTLGVGGDANLVTGGVYRINGFPMLASVGTDTSVAVGRTGTIPAASTNSVAIGTSANAGISSVSIGQNAGNTGQLSNAVAVGNQAGQYTQAASTVAVGSSAGRYTQGTGAVAIGSSAGLGTTTAGTGQGINAVAIGNQAGQDTQGGSSVAVGPNAGRYTQGNSTVAIGNQAGQGTTTAGTGQGGSAVAIGTAAGLDTQFPHAVAIGTSAGRNIQGSNAVAIGRLAGETNQHFNSIILNSSGAALNSDGSSRFYVKPIRSLVDPSLPRLSYNATTGEICYGDSTTASLLPITLDKVNTRVGINKTVPTTALDVGGAVTASGAIVSGGVSTATLSLTGIPNTTTTNALYYDATTKAVSYGAPAGGSTPVYTEGFLAADVTKGSDGQRVIFTVPLTAGVYQFQASVIMQAEGVRSTIYIRYGATGTIMNSVTTPSNGNITTAYVATVTQLIKLTAATDILVCCNSQNAATEMIYANTPIPSRLTAKTGWFCVKLA